MTTTWTPFRNYADTHHVLGAGFCFVHPNGNIYGWACEQIQDKRQNLVIYRSVQGAAPVEVVRFEGTVDAVSFIERGGCIVAPDGALWVATTLQPIGKVYDEKKRTGFEGVWCRIPGIDAPYMLGGDLPLRMLQVETEVNRLQGIVARLDREVAALSGGAGLSAEDREALDRLRKMLRI